MSLINLIVAVGKAFPEWHREQAYTDLLALDDYSLADIGLRRSDMAARLFTGTRAIDDIPQPVTGRWRDTP